MNKAQSSLSSSFDDTMTITRARTVQPVRKAMTTTGDRPSVDSPDNIVLLRYEERRPLATVRKESFSDIEEVARRFISCPPYARLKFHTNLNGVGNDEVVDIDPALWPHIHNAVTSLWIEVDPRPGSDSPQSLIRIFVVIWCQKTICVRINARASVATLKAMVQNKEDIPPGRQRVSFRGSEMDDDERLDSYGVSEDSGVFLITRRACLP